MNNSLAPRSTGDFVLFDHCAGKVICWRCDRSGPARCWSVVFSLGAWLPQICTKSCGAIQDNRPLKDPVSRAPFALRCGWVAQCWASYIPSPFWPSQPCRGSGHATPPRATASQVLQTPPHAQDAKKRTIPVGTKSAAGYEESSQVESPINPPDVETSMPCHCISCSCCVLRDFMGGAGVQDVQGCRCISREWPDAAFLTGRAKGLQKARDTTRSTVALPLRPPPAPKSSCTASCAPPKMTGIIGHSLFSCDVACGCIMDRGAETEQQRVCATPGREGTGEHQPPPPPSIAVRRVQPCML